MKVLLINPPLNLTYPNAYVKEVIHNLFFNSPPLGICYLAAVLEKDGIEVKIIDAAVERLDTAKIVERVRGFAPDVLGLTSTTCNFQAAVVLAQEVKRVFPHIMRVLGGPHLSADAQRVFSTDTFDVGVLGEGEVTFLELIQLLIKKEEWRHIEGIVYRKEGRVVRNPPRPHIADLDSLPFPARHLLPLTLYRPQYNDEYLLPKMSMVTSRGCPYSCIFCDKSVFGAEYRSFSPHYIVSEMKYLVDHFGAKDIAFVDSTFTLSKERVGSITQEIRKSGLSVRWTCTVRANVVTKELLKKMKNAGCWRTRIGIESGNDQVLKFINKGITKQQVRDAVRWADELGLHPKGFFMIGHPVDTKETIEETIRFAKSLPLKDITVQINTPMLATQQYQMYREYGSLITEDLSDFSYWDPVFVPNGLSREYLLEAFRNFYRSFYLRPVIWWRHMLQIRHWYNIVRYVRCVKLFGHLLFDKVQYVNKNKDACKQRESARGVTYERLTD